MLSGLALMMCLGTPVSGAPEPIHADPIHTDPEKYTVVFENDRVRVLRYHDRPGERTTMHHHPDMVVVAITPFKRRITLPDGTSKLRTFAAGDFVWNPDQGHVGENVGDTESNVLLVELKEPRPAAPTGK